MCNQLLQVYACGCTKPVCATPCLPALAMVVPVSNPDPFADTQSILETSTSTSPSSQLQSPIQQTTRRPSSMISVLTAEAQCATLSSPPKSTSPSNTDSVEARMEPSWCTLFAAKRLPASRHPCLLCYLRPEWTELRQRWINDYRIGHPLTKPEDLVRLAGVEGTADKVGLVNVMIEMDKIRDEEQG